MTSYLIWRDLPDGGTGGEAQSIAYPEDWYRYRYDRETGKYSATRESKDGYRKQIIGWNYATWQGAVEECESTERHYDGLKVRKPIPHTDTILVDQIVQVINATRFAVLMPGDREAYVELACQIIRGVDQRSKPFNVNNDPTAS